MKTNTEERTVETLDQFASMDIDAARGVRDETNLLRRKFITPPGEQDNPTLVDVIHAGHGVVIVADRYEQEDLAWSAKVDAQEVLDDLVSDGVLAECDPDRNQEVSQ